MTFPLPPNEAVIYAELVRLLDAREVDGAALEPRRGAVGETSGPSYGPAPFASKVGAAPVYPDPLFPRTEAA